MLQQNTECDKYNSLLKDLIKDKSKMRTIIGAMKGSRFGSSIATQDIDGDSIPGIYKSLLILNT